MDAKDKKAIEEKKVLKAEPKVSRYALDRTKGVSAKQYILSEEAATDQLMMILAYYDIDIARVKDPEQAAIVERGFDQIVDYIRLGKVDVRRNTLEKIEVVHTLESGSVVIYGEVGAQAKLAMDKVGQAGFARIYALMGSLSSLGSDGIQKFPARDLSVVEVLGQLFMHV